MPDIIVGSNSADYTAVTADLGANLYCRVTATNIAGNAAANSNSVGPVAAAAGQPINWAAPVVTGTTTVGQVLGCTTGSWDGDPPITYGYQWYRDGVSISGAVGSTYTLVTADLGANMYCKVTATNGVGSAEANSSTVGPVASVPVNTELPVISGTAQEGQTLTSTTGFWDGTPAPTFTYQWYRRV